MYAPIYEVTAAGFDGSSDATDDRVYWIKAATADEVKRAIADTGAKFCGQVSLSDSTEIDFTLPQDAMRLSETLLEWASHERNKNR